MGLLELTKEDLESQDYLEVRNNLHRMTNSIHGLTALVSDILALCKADLADQTPEPINIHNLLVDIFQELKPLATDRRVTLTENSNSVYASIPLQQTRLRQILRNLIENGIKYAAPERAQNSQAFVEVTASANNNKLDITISDNGLGIPEEYQHKIFDIFCRFHPEAAEGSGLGMSIVQKHVQAMSGSLTFTSTVNQGTTFSLSLPIEHPQAHMAS